MPDLCRQTLAFLPPYKAERHPALIAAVEAWRQRRLEDHAPPSVLVSAVAADGTSHTAGPGRIKKYRSKI
jgi:hypothetical protein